jgi:hypothetical protein
MRVYDYVFFKICQILNFFGESSSFAAIIVMCWLFMFNSFTLMDYFLYDYEISALRDAYMNISSGVLIFGGHLLYFYYNKRYSRISMRFKNEGRYSSIFGTLGVVLYVFLSLWIFFKLTVPFVGGKF